MDRKPITKVRVSAKRLREPDVLSPTEIASLDLRERAMVMLTESIWHQVVGVCKTEASAKPVPMDEYMAEDLLRWRRSSPYPMEGDWGLLARA